MTEAELKALDARFGSRRWHCDHIWADRSYPPCVIEYLDVARAPAVDKQHRTQPPLFATFEGRRVRVVMASRLGDVGISNDLTKEYGYFRRVFLPELTHFSDVP